MDITDDTNQQSKKFLTFQGTEVESNNASKEKLETIEI